MLNVGLTASELRLYHRDLATSHEVRYSINILDTAHRPKGGNVASMLLDGQIDGEVIRLNRLDNPFADFDDPCILHTLTMTLLDPGYTLGFDSALPSDSALYLDRMISVVQSDYSPSLGRWVDCPIFCGPVSDLTRNDDIVTVTAQSKEALAADQINQTVTFHSLKVVDIIRNLLARTGETSARMSIPAFAAKSAKDVPVVRESRAWAKAFWLSESLGQHLMYDGRGVVKMQGAAPPVFTFDGTNILEFPSHSYGTSEVVNVVRVVVGGGAGQKPKIDVTVPLPYSHPNSAKKLGRNGSLRNRLLTIEDDTYTTRAGAVNRAKAELKSRQATDSGTSFTALPVPGLELWDYVYVKHDGQVAKQQVTAFTKPLTVEGVMTVGQTQMVQRPIRRTRA